MVITENEMDISTAPQFARGPWFKSLQPVHEGLTAAVAVPDLLDVQSTSSIVSISYCLLAR
jgi:hypothetical protein